ncbi:MAG: HIT domain-containing protein [Candidatus Gastranaerophilales bacterium]|nr:HIT domain-containing protein [bacterium]MBR2068805.1 HIT domain-containing protein [Candidatus Gastranaerophilales bacterium]
MSDCIFCNLKETLPKEAFVYKDDFCYAINDINPKAKHHILVIPNEHVESLNEVEDTMLIKHLFDAIKKITKEQDIKSFKTLINTGKDAGQEVFHLHIHILAN